MGVFGERPPELDVAESNDPAPSATVATAMSDPFDEIVSVPSRIGATWSLDDRDTGRLPIRSEICRGGVPYASAVMMLSDTIVGMRLERDVPDAWTFTTDYSLRRTTAQLPEGAELVATARPLRHGSRLLVEAVDHHVNGEAWAGHAQITFMRTPMRAEDEKMDSEAIAQRMAGVERTLLDEPLVDAAGIEVTAPGTARLVPVDEVRRPGGFVQGAIITLLGEMAALSLAEAHHGRTCAVRDLDVRYLLGGRTGPLVATASWLGDPTDGRVAVETIDTGHGDVVTTTHLATVEPVAGE